MKKFTTLCLSLLFATTAFSQAESGTFSLQPKVGLNLSNILASDENLDMKAGLATGLEFNYQINRLIALSFGGLYSQQGGKQSINGTDVTIKLDYFNIPALINFYVTKGLALKAGLQLGFLVNDKANAKRNGTSLEMSVEQFIHLAPQYSNVELRKFDVAIPIGISYEFSNVVIDARYCAGLVPLFNDSRSSDRNSVFQLSVGYKFDL